MILFVVKFFIFILLLIILTILYAKYAYTPAGTIPLPSERCVKGDVKWGFILIVTSLACYAFLSFLLSLSWLGGDDFFFPHNQPFIEHVKHAAWKYCNWVSRFGETVAAFSGVSENRWQHFIFTPLFIVLIPFALFRLIKENNTNIFNFKGFLFYLFILGILLIQPDSNGWRNFRCYAASVNYLWPLLGISFFLSFYRSNQYFNSKKFFISIPSLWILGVYSGWSMECISCFMIPILTTVCTIKTIKKKCYLPQFAGLLGSWLGAYMLFASPALSRRAISASASCPIHVSDMSFSEAFKLACSITPDNMHQLAGGSINAYVGDFPFILRALFVPELISVYLPCCAVALIACLLFLIITQLQGGNNKKRIFIIACIGSALSFLCAMSYLMSCIPYAMSFLPATFIMLATAGFLFLRTRARYSMIVVLPIVGYALYYLIPPTCEAYTFKPERDAQFQLIHHKIQQGEKNIDLPYPLSREPIDRLGLIKSGIFANSYDQYPNSMARAYFKIDNIRTLPKDDKNEEKAR